jgi:hypothetical protein
VIAADFPTVGRGHECERAEKFSNSLLAVKIKPELAGDLPCRYNPTMIIITFPDAAAKRRALGYLSGRFPFKSWANGEMMVPEEALSHLQLEGIEHVVEGPATYEHLIPTVRDPSAPAV